MTEEWRPVVGFPHYEISNLGRVRSLDHENTYKTVDPRTGKTRFVKRPYKGKILRPGTVKSGHQLVVLGRGNSRLIHRLVLEAFVGQRPDGQEACHYDDDPKNNRLENLRWAPRSQNIADYHRNYGRHQNGWGGSRV